MYCNTYQLQSATRMLEQFQLPVCHTSPENDVSKLLLKLNIKILYHYNTTLVNSMSLTYNYKYPFLFQNQKIAA